MLKLNFILKRPLLILATVAALIIAVSLFLVTDRTQLTDCEIARNWDKIKNTYGITPVESFEVFLEKRFRIFDEIVPGGLFTSPEYSVAIHYPKVDRFTAHYFRISRDGVILAQRSLSIDFEDWSSARKITCVNVNGGME